MFSSSNVQGTSNDSAVERYLAKPITVGAAGYALSKVIMPSLVDTNWSRTLSFDQGSMLARFSGKREISMPVLAALAVGLGSVLSEVAHEFVFPHIHYLEKNGEPSALAVASAVSSAGLYGGLYSAQPEAITALGPVPIIALGVTSEIVGDYLYANVIKKRL